MIAVLRKLGDRHELLVQSSLNLHGHLKHWRELIAWTLGGWIGLASLVLAGGCQNESAQWEHASARIDIREGRVEAAIEKLKHAIENADDPRPIKLELAALYAQHDRAHLGIAIYDELIDESPESLGVHELRSACFQYLGRFDEALEAYQAALSECAKKTPGQLNNLAYYRALAKKELPRAARQIDLAIQSAEKTGAWSSSSLPLTLRSTIAIGLVARHFDEQAMALPLLNQHIEEYEGLSHQQQSIIDQLVTAYVSIEFPLPRKSENSINRERSRLARTQDALVLMLATRCLVNEDLGHHACVDHDRQQIEALGYDLEVVFQGLPTDLQCFELLKLTSWFIDTRGFVRTRLPWQPAEVHRWAKQLDMEGPGLLSSSEMALADLDLAVAAAELAYLVCHSELYNRYELASFDILALRKEAKHTIAVLRNHRMEAHLKAGNQEPAAIDEARIKKLGLEPGVSLF